MPSDKSPHSQDTQFTANRTNSSSYTPCPSCPFRSSERPRRRWRSIIFAGEAAAVRAAEYEPSPKKSRRRETAAVLYRGARQNRPSRYVQHNSGDGVHTVRGGGKTTVRQTRKRNKNKKGSGKTKKK